MSEPSPPAAPLDAPADTTSGPNWLKTWEEYLRVTSPDDLKITKPSLVRHIARFLMLLIRNVTQNALTRRASSLTYTTILSLFPLFVLMIAMGSFFFTPQKQEELFQTIQDKLYPASDGVAIMSSSTPVKPGASGKDMMVELRGFVTGRAASFRQSAAGIGFAGFGALLFAAMMLYAAIEDAFDSVWRGHARKSIKRTILTFAATLLFAPILIGGSLAMSGVSVAVHRMQIEATKKEKEASQTQSEEAAETARNLGSKLANLGISSAARVFLWALPYLLNAVVLMLAYALVPQSEVRWKFAFYGGLVGGILWEISKVGFASYVAMSAIRREIFSSLGALPIFLIWIYTTWVFFLFGNEVAYCLQNYQRLALERFFSRRFTALDGKLTLAILIMVHGRFGTGRGATAVNMLTQALGLRPGEVEELLARLTQEGYLFALDGGRFSPAKPADKVIVREVVALGCDAMTLPLWSGRDTVASQAAEPLRRVQELALSGIGALTLSDVLAMEPVP